MYLINVQHLGKESLQHIKYELWEIKRLKPAALTTELFKEGPVKCTREIVEGCNFMLVTFLSPVPEAS